MALERGEREYLEELAASAARRLRSARRLWDATPLESIRAVGGASSSALWDDLEARSAEIVEHTRARRFFWADVVGRQLADHHVVGIEELLRRCGVEGGQVDETVGSGITPERARARGAAWLRVESRPSAFDAVRTAIRESCEERVDGGVQRALESGDAPSPALRSWLAQQLAAAVAEGRAGDGAGVGSDDPIRGGSRYGRRDVLLEELAAVDPSLAALAAQHLLACDLLAAVDGAEAVTLREGGALATVVSQGSISNRPLPTETAEDSAHPAVAQGAELHGEAPLVLAAVADWLVVVRGNRGYVVPVDDPGV